jgi:hypothetical protein
MVLAATAASALQFSVVSASTPSGDLLNVGLGDQIIVEVNVSYDQAQDGTGINGLGASAYNYDSILSFVSGSAATQILSNEFLPGNPTGVLCTVYGLRCEDSWGGGLPNQLPDPGNLVQTLNTPGTEQRVAIFQGIDLDNLWGPDAVTPQQGADGLAGSAQFVLVFQASAAGTSELTIGTGVDLGGVVTPGNYQAENAILQITVVPEPGTALLMGLGLAGLAAAGRRK